MTVRLDIGPAQLPRSGYPVDEEPQRRVRRGRIGLNFVRLPARKNPGPLVLLDDPFALRYLGRA